MCPVAITSNGEMDGEVIIGRQFIGMANMIDMTEERREAQINLLRGKSNSEKFAEKATFDLYTPK